MQVPLWAALLDLTDSYGIYTDAFPAGRVALGPGERTSLELAGEVPDALWQEGTVAVTDRLVVVTSTIEFDPRSLQQGDLAVSAVPGHDGTGGLGGRDDALGVHAPLDPRADARRGHHEAPAAAHDRDDRGLAHQPHRRRDDAPARLTSRARDERERACRTTKGRTQSRPALRARVELRGLEPLTPSMPWRCATSCATAPFGCRPAEATA